MPQVHIRTKVHKIPEFIQQGLVYILGGTKGPTPLFHFDHDPAIVRSLYQDTLASCPIFSIDPALMEIASTKDFHRSILDMKRAEVMRLPFPAMIVEFECKQTNSHIITMLRDLRHRERLHFEDQKVLDKGDKDNFDFYGLCFMVRKQEGRSYLVAAPGATFVSLDIDKPPNKEHNIFTTISSSPMGIVDNGEAMVLIPNCEETCAFYLFKGLSAALLLMSTQGVKKEVIECGKINKQRHATGKDPIPRHTYISIGHVYRSGKGNVSDVYHDRRSPRPHWRRGHHRGVHYGKGREHIRSVYINPRLVAFTGDREPTPGVYIVKP